MPDATIICVSANPAMDRRLRVARLSVGEINRAASAQGFAGGKAAHVAMAAHAMAAKAVWIGFLGGPIGQECARQMKDLGIQVVAIPTAAETRVNLEVIEESGNVTEILEPGAKPSAEERDAFLEVCARQFRNEGQGALLVVSGSLPVGLGPEFYDSLIGASRAAGARVFVDTSGDALRESSKASPDFVKTNRAEAEALLGRPVTTRHEAVHAAMAIIENGAGSAAITLGAEGFVWVESRNGPVWTTQPPRLKVISTVGCGDATLGGFACAAARGIVGEEALRLAAACGAANCLAAAPGRIDLAIVESLIPQIEVQRLGH
ncbi:MAG: hexose kinase [Candidatus Acidiferrales bacterium]